MKQDKTTTPETDEMVFYTEQKTFCDMVVSDFARRLERGHDSPENDMKPEDTQHEAGSCCATPTCSLPTTGRQAQILGYIRGSDNRWCSPTEIGRGVWGQGHHSASASPVCLRMVKKGWLERNERGHYRIPANPPAQPPNG